MPRWSRPSRTPSRPSRFYDDPHVIVDVGGQDIKLIVLKDGRVKDFKLNTQCSAGNGYFLQSTAEGFGIPVREYADKAFSATAMPLFGYGCAVFMQSDIVNFQRQGWAPEEILAGLAAVLPKNIFLYVASIPNLAKLGTPVRAAGRHAAQPGRRQGARSTSFARTSAAPAKSRRSSCTRTAANLVRLAPLSRRCDCTKAAGRRASSAWTPFDTSGIARRGARTPAATSARTRACARSSTSSCPTPGVRPWQPP